MQDVGQNMPEYARICQNMPEYARICQNMADCDRLWQPARTVSVFADQAPKISAQVCDLSVRLCSSDQMASQKVIVIIWGVKKVIVIRKRVLPISVITLSLASLLA